MDYNTFPVRCQYVLVCNEIIFHYALYFIAFFVSQMHYFFIIFIDKRQIICYLLKTPVCVSNSALEA